MKTKPKTVKLIKYHWRHCSVFNPADNNKHLFDATQQFGHEHAFPNDPTPEEKCKSWLTENGYVPKNEGDKHKTGEVWELAA